MVRLREQLADMTLAESQAGDEGRLRPRPGDGRRAEKKIDP
jgi:hypothetical protein